MLDPWHANGMAIELGEWVALVLWSTLKCMLIKTGGLGETPAGELGVGPSSQMLGRLGLGAFGWGENSCTQPNSLPLNMSFRGRRALCAVVCPMQG